MSSRRKHLELLVLSLALALALLSLAAWDLQRAFSPDYSGRVVSAIVEQVRASPVTMGRLYGFGATVAAMYLLLGLIVWLSSVATLCTFERLRRYRHFIVLGWFVAITLTIGFFNADFYPHSRAGLWSRAINDFVAPSFGLWRITLPILLGAWIGLAAGFLHRRGWTRMGLRVAAWGLLLTAVVITIGWIERAQQSLETETASGHDSPHIILIGIDSLRPSLVGDRAQFGYMPILSDFVQSGHRFTDATTPLARTFPSWMTMLTGQRPTSTGIRENLMPRELVEPPALLPQILRERGYHTVYATDEVRFSNIDTTYGFDAALTPRIGASDFLLGRANDLPLTNMVANTWLAQWLFPDSFANRAAATTYDPMSFVERLERGIQPEDRPLFLAVHLTLPHWPYRWRDEDGVFSGSYDTAYAYLGSVVEADRQFGEVMRVLNEKGVLNHALVVVFSDHGEGLSRASDSLVQLPPGELRPHDLPAWVWGHGTSVLSAPQFEIFLAARTYGIAGYGGAATHPEAVSIEDVAPTILDVIGSGDGHEFDGMSMAGLLKRAGPKGLAPVVVARTDGPRIRFTESAYSTPSLRQGAADEASLLEEGSDVFRVNPATGWVEIRTELWSELMAVRERAAIGPTKLLAAVPTDVPGMTSYYVVPRSGGSPVRLNSAPRTDEDAEVALLWNALIEEYGDELGRPTDATRLSNASSPDGAG